ncbi:phage tail tip lysozyme [Rhizobium mayense]|uniref:phage tail tip lysozyme n=1 Tax=Rhizobium mayense TaxID=1312184 RepID=UPI00398C65EB
MADNDNNLVFTVSSDMSAASRGLNKFTGDIDTATNKISRKFESLGNSIDKGVSSALQQRINSMVGVGTAAAKEWNGALADQGKQLDALRAKYSPLFSVVKQYQSAQADIRTLYRSGKIGVDEYTAALSKQRQAALANIAAIKGVPKAQNDNGGSNSYIFKNLAYQVNQIGQQGAVTGNYLQALAIQLPDILASFGSLPLVLAGGALAVGGSFLSMALETKKLDDVLADHEKLINRIVAAYGGLAEQAAKAPSDSKKLIDALGTKNETALRLSAASQATSFFQNPAVGRTVTGGRFGERGQGYYAINPQFQKDLEKLRAEYKAGKPDFDAFYESISRKVELDPSLSAAAVKVIAESEKFKEATDAVKQYQRVRNALFNDQGPTGRLLSQGTTNTADAGNLALYESQQRIALQRSQRAIEAEIASINARSPAERIAAARAGAAAQYNDDESPAQRRQRIDSAGLVAQAQIEKQISDAQRDRSLSLQKLIDDQQNEINLTGKSSQEADVLRKAYELTSQIRIQAAKDGTQVDEKEIETIRLKTIELGKLQQAYKALSTGVTSRGFVIGSPAEQDYFDYTDNQRLSLERGQESFDSQVASLRARTIAQRVAAARQAAEAQHPDESAPEREQRINNAGLLAREQINRELADAERERSLNLRRLLEDQRQDIALIGKTGGAAAAATQQYQQLAQLRAEAAKQGITDEAEFQKVFGRQIDLINSTAESYGKLVDVAGRLKLYHDLNDQNRLAALPTRDRQIVEMQRQYGQPEDPNSETGQAIGKSIDAQANREAVTSFLTDFKDGLVKNGESIGKAFGQALQNALMKQADKLWENLFNQIANAIFGTKSASASGATGIAGAGVNAASRLLSPNLMNGSPASPASQSGVAAQAWNFFASKGLQPHQVAGILGNISAESAFNPKAVGDAGKALGLFQWNDRAPKMLSAIGGRGNLGDVNAQLEHAWSELQGPENRAFQALMKSTDVRGATAAFAGFERPQGFSWANPEGAHNFSGRLDAANDALSKFGNTTNQATQGLGTLGNGLGQLGTTLGNGAGGAATSGGGGLFGWLGNLFGGGSSQFKAAQAGLLKPGLFADGGHVAGPGTSRSDSIPAWLSNGEFVVNASATKKHRTMLEAINRGSVAKFADGGLVTPQLVSAPSAPTLRPRAASTANDNRNPGILHVQISGASGDEHVRTLVKQGVGEGLAQYNTQQRRGGFGRLQNQYANQKA